MAEYFLTTVDNRLELHAKDPTIKSKIYVEFLKGPLGYRRRRGGGFSQLLARAVGIKAFPKSDENPVRVIDATAGLGNDAFVLASLGCHVLLVERSSILVKLLQDGLKRAEEDTDVGAWVKERMQVVEGDAIHLLGKLEPKDRPEVVYLDPMFPPSKKSALTKIDLRIIRDIVGDDVDAEALLAKALETAKRRVVVKRPLRAPEIRGFSPNFVVSGRRNRYDVYLIGN